MPNGIPEVVVWRRLADLKAELVSTDRVLVCLYFSHWSHFVVRAARYYENRPFDVRRIRAGE